MRSDDDLMLASQAGDGLAFNELMNRHGHKLFGWLVKHTRQRALSEDLTQDVWLRVWEKRATYAPQGEFLAWLFLIARRRLIDHTRRASHDCLKRLALDADHDSLDGMAGDGPAPDVGCAAHDLDDEIDMGLEALPDDQRTTVVLYHFAGKSLPDIAALTEVSLSTAKGRLRLGREKLAPALAKH